MKSLRALSVLFCLTWMATAGAQVSPAPPAAATPPTPSAAKPKAKPHAPKKPVVPSAIPKTPATPARPGPTVTNAPAPDDAGVDLVFGAYQRGMYKTAFDLATKRVQETGDPKAMTMLGEL